MEKKPKMTYKMSKMSGFNLKASILYALPIPLTNVLATSPSIDSHHGFDLSERSGLTNTGMLRGERRQRRGTHRTAPASTRPHLNMKRRQAGRHDANAC